MQSQYSSAQYDKTIPIAIPVTLDGRDPEQYSRIVGPLTFIEVVRELHTATDGAVVFARKNNWIDARNQRALEPIGGCTVAELKKHATSILELLRTDGFMTINSVHVANRAAKESRLVSSLRNYRRRAEDLRWLNAAFVDIDSGKLGFDPEQALNTALDLLAVQALPLPTHFVFSGTGLWLLWKFRDGVRAWREECDLLKRLNQQLVRLFKHLGADPNSVDAARIMRCPESVNCKNGKPVRFFRLEGASAVPFEELVRLFQVPAQRTQLPGERKSAGPKNPNRIRAGKLRYERRLSGFLRLLELRGVFRNGTRHQSIFGLAVLLFKNGMPKTQILAECTRFALTYCAPAVTDRADIERRVNACFRYRQHISDAKFAKWFCITESEMRQLPEWFRPKLPPTEPRNIRIARRRALVMRTSRLFDTRVSRQNHAELITKHLRENDGIDVHPVTILRDLIAIADADTRTNLANISLLNESSSAPPFKQDKCSCRLGYPRGRGQRRGFQECS